MVPEGRCPSARLPVYPSTLDVDRPTQDAERSFPGRLGQRRVSVNRHPDIL